MWWGVGYLVIRARPKQIARASNVPSSASVYVGSFGSLLMHKARHDCVHILGRVKAINANGRQRFAILE